MLKGKSRSFEPGDVITNGCRTCRTSRLFSQAEGPRGEEGSDWDDFDTGSDVTLDLEPLELVTVVSKRVSRKGYAMFLCLRGDMRLAWYREDNDLRLASDLTDEDKTGERMGR